MNINCGIPPTVLSNYLPIGFILEKFPIVLNLEGLPFTLMCNRVPFCCKDAFAKFWINQIPTAKWETTQE